MFKLRLIAVHEYKRHVLRKRFIWALLSVPALLALMVGITALAVRMERDYRPVGYVDHSGMLADPVMPPKGEGAVEIHAFPGEAEAQKALQAGEIQCYYVLPADYVQTSKVELVYLKPPNSNATSHFWDFMQMNWLANQPPEVARRVAAMSDDDIIVQTPDGRREFAAEPTLGDLLPVIAGIAFMTLLGFSGGYLVQVVSEEKENRTMEVLITSASAGEFIGGKVVGLVCVILTQALAWLAFAGAAIVVARRLLQTPFLETVRVDGGVVLMMLAVFVPAFVMYSALMTALGATVAEPQEAQQIAGLFILPNVVPLWMMMTFIQNPNGPIAVALSLFPLTSPVSLTIRATFGIVPAWQAAVAAALLVLSAWGAVWLAGRAFRLGMLRYGKRVGLAELFGRAKPAAGGHYA
ncbi:MAG: ABC transporter permease [Anaerolineae bacterium]|nr:ABC transporter permease [Anaerolineae bacterium]